MEIKLNRNENLLFALKVAFTPLVWLLCLVMVMNLMSGVNTQGVALISTFVMYILLIWLFIFSQKILLVACMKGNGVEVNELQFSDVYRKYTALAENMGVKKVPKLFVLQEGGMLNAFAVRFSGSNYIAIYSEVFSLLEEDEDAVLFVLAHELAHVKRAHLSKRFWTFPSALVPFLNAAYSRACEYTCDNAGISLVGQGTGGLLLLAAGPRLYRKINVDAYIEHHRNNHTFAVSLVGLFLSHPYLPLRIDNIRRVP